jgi:putative serine protease PepD
MDLKVAAAGEEVAVPEGSTAVIGADPSATVRLARPGISRRHAVVKYEGSHWVVQDASSRNGTYHNGAKLQSLDIKGPTTIRLGHPTEGAEVVLTPVGVRPPASPPRQPTVVSPQASAVAPGTPPGRAPAPVVIASGDARLDELIAALNDSVKSIKGLTWSVWAMIAVTAVLALLTLFIGIVGN